MKMTLLNSPFVKNSIETIDFKAFCKGGSPEYQAAKQKLNDLLRFQQENSRKNLTAYSLYINPLALFDVHFLIAVGIVVLVAVTEKKLADHGIIGFATVLSGLLKVAFPIIAFGSIMVLISKLGVFL